MRLSPAALRPCLILRAVQGGSSRECDVTLAVCTVHVNNKTQCVRNGQPSRESLSPSDGTVERSGYLIMAHSYTFLTLRSPTVSLLLGQSVVQ